MSQSSKKRKKTSSSSGSTAAVQDPRSVDGAGGRSGMAIELLTSFEELRKSWPKEMAKLLDPSLPEERRSELWEIMCDGGDILRQRYS